MKAKVKSLKVDIIGKKVGSKYYGEAGRNVEKIFKSQGFPLQNGKGPDWPAIGVEIKTRGVGATSPRTIATMHVDKINVTAYEDSIICDKFQQQHISKHANGVVTSAGMYDFRAKWIQKFAKESYESARVEIQAGNRNDYIRGTLSNGKKAMGYFERCTSGGDSYQFRFSGANYKALENMTKSNYNRLFIESRSI